MLQDISEELAHTVLNGRQALGVTLEVKKCRDLTDDVPNLCVIVYMGNRKEATGLLVLTLDRKSVV